MNKVRLLGVTFLAGALAVPGLAAPRAFAASSGTRPVTDVSSACAGQNAEVEGGPIDRLAGLVRRRSLFPRLVRPVLVPAPT